MSNREEPLISIGIPTYNRPENLRRTLLEFTGQTYKNLEIIVSDNASPNNDTEKVAREFMRADQRIRYVKQTSNIGIHPNFQFVLAQAQGEYFAWSADDDWHEANFVEELYAKLQSDNLAVVAFCDFDSRNEMGERVSGYPDFMHALKLMCESSAFLRQFRFFLLNEGTAKPHSIYGLIRRDVLTGFSWTSFVDCYGEYAQDALFVFWLMTKGRLALSEHRLFGCTVGNRKDYSATNKWTIRAYLKLIGQLIKYLYGYVRIARGATSVAIVLVFPWKMFEIINLFAIKPAINWFRRRLCRNGEKSSRH